LSGTVCQIAVVTGWQACQDAHDDFAGSVCTVLLQIELPLEHVDNRPDGLAERFEGPAAASFGFALAGAAQQLDAAIGDDGLELACEVGSCL
jgi:hypothetical protein